MRGPTSPNPRPRAARRRVAQRWEIESGPSSGTEVRSALRHRGLIAHLAQRRHEAVATALQGVDVDRETLEVGKGVLEEGVRERVASGDLLHQDLPPHLTRSGSVGGTVRRWHDAALRELFATHSGEEIDHAGDGFFVAFAAPASALDCAVAIQRRLAEHRLMAGFAPEVRIGVHADRARSRDGSYKGSGVHRAARIAAAAAGGEIVASRQTLDTGGRPDLLEERMLRLKGFPDPVAVGVVARQARPPG